MHCRAATAAAAAAAATYLTDAGGYEATLITRDAHARHMYSAYNLQPGIRAFVCLYVWYAPVQFKTKRLNALSRGRLNTAW